jgi:hypothetical protein
MEKEKIIIDHNDNDDKLYERLAHQIEREDGLVNIRLGWMLATQGLLFTAFALVVGKDIALETYKLMKWLMPLMGAGIALFTLFGVLGAHWALWHLKEKWHDNKGITFNPDKHIRPFGDMVASSLGFIPSLSLPLVFIIAWSIINTRLPQQNTMPEATNVNSAVQTPVVKKEIEKQVGGKESINSKK